MLMTSILMSIMVMVSMVMIGCTSQPPPIPTPMVIVDERLMVMDALTRFNNTNNNFIRFLEATNDVYQFSEANAYHVSYVNSTIILKGLSVYDDAIDNWNPPEESSYYDRLIELKEAELYRIEYFSELTNHLLTALPTENDDVIQIVRDEFLAWRDASLNQKSMELQNDIIKELNINPDDVDFLYIVPDKPVPTLPSIFKGDNRS